MAVVGIGQELRGDDAAGVLVARRLAALTHPFATGQPSAPPGAEETPPAPGGFTIIEAAHAPENCTGTLRRFAPDLVLLVDAAEMGQAPGTIRWLAWQETSGLGASTHTLPPYMLARFLVASLGCEVALLGIQPAQNEFDAPLSAPVAAAVEAVATTLRELLLAPRPAPPELA